MPEERDCVVKLVDDHGVEHSVNVRAESVYEAALGFAMVLRKFWEDGKFLWDQWRESDALAAHLCG